MIPAYSPEARGRSERMFSTHQGRLPKELCLAGITEMEEANKYLREHYMPAFNEEFMQPALEEGSAFVGYRGGDIDDILCEQHDRVVGKDNCVEFERLKLQIPQDKVRLHYVKVNVRVHKYPDGGLAIFHGPRLLCRYEADGSPAGIKLSAVEGRKKDGQGRRSEWRRRRATPSAAAPRIVAEYAG
jgi:hypothetical protein